MGNRGFTGAERVPAIFFSNYSLLTDDDVYVIPHGQSTWLLESMKCLSSALVKKLTKPVMLLQL